MFWCIESWTVIYTDVSLWRGAQPHSWQMRSEKACTLWQIITVSCVLNTCVAVHSHRCIIDIKRYIHCRQLLTQTEWFGAETDWAVNSLAGGWQESEYASYLVADITCLLCDTTINDYDMMLQHYWCFNKGKSISLSRDDLRVVVDHTTMIISHSTLFESILYGHLFPRSCVCCSSDYDDYHSLSTHYRLSMTMMKRMTITFS